MQSGGGNGRNPTSSSAPPTSSSNGGSAPTNFRQLGLQQQLLQQLQHQQLRKAEGEDTLLAYQHGVSGGSIFPPRNLYQQQGGPQPCEENQNRGQVMGQQSHNPIHQSHPQFAFQAAAQQQSLANLLLQQQGKIGMLGSSGKDHEMLVNNQKMQQLMSLQAASQFQLPVFKKSTELGQTSNDKGSEQMPPSLANMIRPMQSSQPSMQNAAANQLGLPQLKAIQAWAQQNNIDLSVPANVNLMNQLLPLWQSARMNALQKQNEPNTAALQSRPPSMKSAVMSSPAGSENSAEGNSLSDLSGHVGPLKGQSNLHGGPVLVGTVASGRNSHAVQMQHQSAVRGSENQNDTVGKSPLVIGNGGPSMQKPTFRGMDSGGEQSHANSAFIGTESLQSQHLRPLQQLNRSLSHPSISPSEGLSSKVPRHAGSTQMVQQHIGFTKQQQHVLKAQILAFRRIKRGDHTLPQEVLAAIVPPPLDLQFQQTSVSSGMVNREMPATNNVDGHTGHEETSEKQPQLTPLSKDHNLTKEEPVSGEEKVVHHAQGAGFAEEQSRLAYVGNVGHTTSVKTKEVEGINQITSSEGENDGDKDKSLPMNIATAEAGKLKKPALSSNTTNSKEVSTRKYHGPLFDFPYFNRRSETLGSPAVNCSSNFTFGYDVKDLLFEEGINVLNKKRTENLKKINGLLAVNLERKRIRPDLVLRLQIKEKKLRLLDLQARLRDEVEQQQQEIMAMSDRPYRKFVRECERQRVDLSRQVQQIQKLSRDKQLKSIFQWRKKLLEAHWAIRDARTTRNRGVAKYHEKMLREFSKRKDDGRNRRMEALKNNDVDRYREMLLEQQTSVPGDAAQRYAVLSSFLSQTEEYLLKLGGKITASKTNQEVEEAANAAARAARSQGLSEEEVKAAAACAREEVMIRNRFSEMNAPKDSSSVSKYYNLAHAVNESVVKQPSMLHMGTLRDYQLVGLQWMLSLYNNKLNGILADEMGLGKTVQVMALIAYLMEFKGNYGPHLIIVPNAVLVNWKSELHKWLPSAKCIFYVGRKELRSKLFSHVVSMKFNILVTTYEFVMYDRSKLSKVNWKYIIIDEAQRMKDRESVLARDLDRYSCQRRLLLTGTPLQNDLKELWSLLNLLLPEVFDNRKAFHDWFSQPFQRDGSSQSPEEDDWLETEKKVIIIHRLHQILEPFMLRRRVEDVEGALPPKVPIVLRCRMSAIQSAIYDWIKSTGTVRVDPEDEMRKAEKNPMYQVKMYKNLNNKCMELRKVCNHPLLNYPYFNDYSKDFLVRSCGKLWVLDRVLVKLQRAGHRVLLFSTMTKLLDLLEEYLRWRRLVYRRIDGSTCLEDREAAIVDFNSPDSDSFIFLLSIRAAGRGLNLQSADTVVIYDPDSNPQNEEQAVARAHRIGQTREVKVIYMEAVVDKISSFQKEDELRNGGSGGDLEDDLVGKDRYVGSIESLIRSNIQQYKLDMADEVINAGRFDQRTTHEERRMTLESLLHDEDRGQQTVHDVPSLQEVNRMIARSKEEVELFDQMDEEFDWTRDMVKYNQVPRWLRAGSREVDAIVCSLSKKPSKNVLTTNISLDATDAVGLSSSRAEKRRGRPKGSSTTAKRSIYVESDDEDNVDSDASSDVRIANLSQDEEGERGEDEDEQFDDGVDVPSNNRDHSEEELLFHDGDNHDPSTIVAEGIKNVPMFEGALSAGSTGSRRLPEHSTSSMLSQKFGSLSALDAKPGHLSNGTPAELEEGEIAASGDSHMDLQQSGSWIHDRDDGEEEQVLQPKLKRKRSIRSRPTYTVERLEEQSTRERNFRQHESVKQSRTDQEVKTFSEPVSQKKDTDFTSSRQKRNPPSRKNPPVFPRPGRLNNVSGSVDEVADPSDWPANHTNSDGPSLVNTNMSESMQRKCKNVVSKFKRRIDKDGHQIVPILFDLWKRNENSSFSSNFAGSGNLLDLHRIEQRVDGSNYNGVMDFIADVQSMLETVVRYSSYSPEVGKEAGKLQGLFFDIMKIAFPDTDFRRIRKSVTFSNPGEGPTPSNQNKGKAKMIGKEPKPSASNLREQSPLPERGPPLLLAHPGDLVICKKKRKDRDKQRVGPASPPSNNTAARAGPLSPPSAGWATGGSSGMQEVQWAKPVKRTRTDAGKRRPSHL